jgi:hypothetical protein
VKLIGMEQEFHLRRSKKRPPTFHSLPTNEVGLYKIRPGEDFGRYYIASTRQAIS